jgi:hypothetical protein
MFVTALNLLYCFFFPVNFSNSGSHSLLCCIVPSCPVCVFMITYVGYVTGNVMLGIYFTAVFGNILYSFIHSACVECDDSLPFSGASSIPFCYVLFPATLLHQLFIHPLSPHLCHLFLGLPLNLVPKFIYKILYYYVYFKCVN